MCMGVQGRSLCPCLTFPHACMHARADLIADQQGLSREEVKSWTPYAGGAPCNVATALGKLGQEVLFVTALGKDKRGDELCDLIKSEEPLHSDTLSHPTASLLPSPHIPSQLPF